jgi:hypothetical protein
VVLLILAVVWAIFLVPQVLRARATRTGDSVGAFAQQLSVLGRTTPAGSPHLMRPLPMVPNDHDDDDLGPARLTLDEARKRRKDVMKVLLLAMAATFVLALLPPLRKLLLVHLVLDVVFVAYLVLLYRAQAVTGTRRVPNRRRRVAVAPRHRDDLLPGDDHEVDEEQVEDDDAWEPDDDDTGDGIRILEHAGR